MDDTFNNRSRLTILAIIFVDMSRVDKIKHLFKKLICRLDELMARSGFD
jgi:hypothetical protein